MDYRVLVQKLNYADESNDFRTLTKGEILKNSMIENNLFRREYIERMVKDNKLEPLTETRSAELNAEVVQTKTQESDSNLQDMSKVELLKLANELKLGTNRDLTRLKKAEIGALIEGSLKLQNRRLDTPDKK